EASPQVPWPTSGSGRGHIGVSDQGVCRPVVYQWVPTHIAGSPAYTYTQNAKNGSSGCRAVSQRSCTGPPHQAQVVTEGRFLLGSESLRAQVYPKAARLYTQLYRISMNTTAE